MPEIDLLSFNTLNAFDGDKFEKALNLLPPSEHQSVLKYKFNKDRYLALASLLLRRHYFSNKLNVPWAQIEFDRHPLGKPFLKNFDCFDFDFNTSHEGHWVIFGCTQKLKIGIDTVLIDRPQGISIDYFINSFKFQLTEEEFQFIMDNSDEEIRLERFYEFWACKESYIKAIGTGLSLDLKKISFENKDNQIKMKLEARYLDRWCYHLSCLDEHYLAAICFGFSDQDRSFDDNHIEFLKTSKLLGEPLHHTKDNNIFHRIKLKDIESSKWILK